MDYSNDERPGGQTYNWPSIFGCNTLYLIVLVLMILFSSGAAGLMSFKLVDTETWLVVTFILEVLVIGVPPLLYLLVKRINITQTVRLNRTGLKELLLVLGMAGFGYGIVSFINLIWYWILSHFGTPVVPELPSINNGSQYMKALLVVALTPAVVEEYLFRGVILRGYERLGTRASVVVSGLLFAFLHLRLSNIPAIIFLGIMIGYVVVSTNSIFAGVLYHFTQNAISISFMYLQAAAAEYLQGAGAVQAEMGDIPPQMWMAFIMVWGLIAIFSLGLFLLCAIALHRVTQFKAGIEYQRAFEKKRPTFKEMLPIVAAGVIIAIMLCIEVIAMTGGLQGMYTQKFTNYSYIMQNLLL